MVELKILSCSLESSSPSIAKRTILRLISFSKLTFEDAFSLWDFRYLKSQFCLLVFFMHLNATSFLSGFITYCVYQQVIVCQFWKINTLKLLYFSIVLIFHFLNISAFSIYSITLHRKLYKIKNLSQRSTFAKIFHVI